MQNCRAFDLSHLVLLLPASLRYLHVELDLGSNFDRREDGWIIPFELSKFQKFPGLRSLHLCVPHYPPGLGIALEQYFTLDADVVLASLKCLHLSPMRLQSSADINFALPNLTPAVLSFPGRDTQKYLHLPSIEDLVLDMIDLHVPAGIGHIHTGTVTLAAGSIYCSSRYHITTHCSGCCNC